MTNSKPYQLFLSQRSPFARRIRLALKRLGLPFDERFVQVFDVNPDLLAANPLGMVPTLLTPEGTSLFESGIILESLHDITGGIWPHSPSERILARQASALASGLIQSTVAYFQETALHDIPSSFWARDHLSNVEDTLKCIERSAPHLWVSHNTLTQAGWDLAVALDYLDIRIPEISWRTRFSSLLPVLLSAEQDPWFQETKPKL